METYKIIACTLLISVFLVLAHHVLRSRDRYCSEITRLKDENEKLRQKLNECSCPEDDLHG